MLRELTQSGDGPGAGPELAALDAGELGERQPEVRLRRVVRQRDLPAGVAQSAAALAEGQAGDVAGAVADPAGAVVAAAVDDDAVIEQVAVALAAGAEAFDHVEKLADVPAVERLDERRGRPGVVGATVVAE